MGMRLKAACLLLSAFATAALAAPFPANKDANPGGLKAAISSSGNLIADHSVGSNPTNVS